MSDLFIPVVAPEFGLIELTKRAAEAPASATVWAQATSAKIKSSSKGKSGKEWVEVEFRDATGTIKLRVWDNVPAHGFCRALKGGEGVELKGTFSKGDYGMESDDWQGRLLQDGEVMVLFGGPASLQAKQAADWGTIVKLVYGMADPHFRKVCEMLLEKKGEVLRRAAAARGNHHARRGGLVEHVAFMMATARSIAAGYPEINPDLLLAGVLFHDAGKIWENQMEPRGFEMPFTAQAEMLGHIYLGCTLATNIWHHASKQDGEEEWPGEKLLHLQHLILAHHGELEFGSPVVPRTMEAVILHYVDQIDAKLEMLRQGFKTQKELAPGVFEKVWPIQGNFVKTPAWGCDGAAPPGPPPIAKPPEPPPPCPEFPPGQVHVEGSRQPPTPMPAEVLPAPAAPPPAPVEAAPQYRVKPPPNAPRHDP